MVNPTVTPGNYNYGILPALLWKTAAEPKAEKAMHLWVQYLLYLSKLYLRPPRWPQVQLRVSDGEAISQAYYFNWTESHGRTSHRKTFHIAPSVPLSWPFISSSGFTSEIPSNEQSVSLSTVKCVIPPQVQHNKRSRRYQGTNRGARLMQAKNAAVLLLEGCHETQTYPLPFSVGIQPKQMQGDTRQKGGERSVSAANKQLEPPMSLSRSRTIAFLWSSCVTRSLSYLFS